MRRERAAILSSSSLESGEEKKNDEDKNVLIFFLYFHSGEHKEVKLSSLFGQIRVILNSVSAGRGETNCVIGM